MKRNFPDKPLGNPVKAHKDTFSAETVLLEAYFRPGRIAQGVECPKCGSGEVFGKEGERCCLSCGAHQPPRS